jgi:hypothetical protein
VTRGKCHALKTQWQPKYKWWTEAAVAIRSTRRSRAADGDGQARKLVVAKITVATRESELRGNIDISRKPVRCIEVSDSKQRKHSQYSATWKWPMQTERAAPDEGFR